MIYFTTDIKKLYKSHMIKWMLFFLLVIMIADPISYYVDKMRYKNFVENIGTNPFQFWLLMNSSYWGNTVFHAMFYIFPVLSTGLVFYHERCSSVFELSIVRGNRFRCYLSKNVAVFMTTFINFFVLLTINVIVTYIIFPSDNPLTQQYTYIIPKEGMFSYPFYQYSPICMVMLYIFLNAFTIALQALFCLSIHAIFEFKNRYAAALIPFFVLYLGNYSVSLGLINHLNYDLNIIIQPQAASSLVEIIRRENVLSAFFLLFLLDAMLFIIGYIRNRETI